jgi:hypothetical protein
VTRTIVIIILGVLSVLACACSLLCVLQGHYIWAVLSHVAGALLGYSSTVRLRGGNSALSTWDRVAAFAVPCVGGACVWLQTVSERWGGKKNVMEDFSAYVDAHLRLGRDALPDVRRADRPRPQHVAPIIDVFQSAADGNDMRKAVENLSRTDSPSAMLTLREALLNESGEVRYYAAAALTMLEERLALRVKMLQEEMAKDPRTGATATLDMARAFFDYAYYHVAEGIFRPHYLQETVTYARRARELGAGSAALLLEGRSLLCLGRFEEAENRFAQCLQKEPHDVKALLWRAEARFRLGRYPGVREDCETALRAGGLPEVMVQVAQMWAAPTSTDTETRAA